MRFEVKDTDTSELYEDYFIENLVRNVTLSQNEFDGRHSCQQEIRFGKVGYFTPTPYMHTEADVWKMSDRINWVLNVCDDYGLDGARIKDMLVDPDTYIYFWKSKLSMEADSKSIKFVGEIDTDYNGYPQ